MSNKGYAELFYAGEYSRILDINEPLNRLTSKDRLYHIASVAFKGNTSHALELENKWAHTLKNDEQVELGFYLLVSLTRISNLTIAQSYFRKLWRLRSDRTCSEQTRFFVFQGLSFYLYFAGRFKSASFTSQKAYQLATLVEFEYGLMISKDLYAHTLFQLGSIDLSLSIFRQNQLKAKQCGYLNLSDAFEISRLIYEAQSSENIETSTLHLHQKIKKLKTNDSYSFVNLILEYSRVLTLQGRYAESESWLNQALPVIYQMNNLRQEAVYLLRFAQLWRLRGDDYLAMNFVQNAKKKLKSHFDRDLWVKCLGLEHALLKGMDSEGSESKMNTLVNELNRSTFKTRTALSLRYLKKINLHDYEVSEDRLSNQLKTISELGSQELRNYEISKQKYYSLFQVYYKEASLLRQDEKRIFILRNNQFFLLSKKGILFLDFREQPLLAKLIFAFAHSNGVLTKEKIVKQIWNYNYHPLRHDSLVYSHVQRLRKCLDLYSDWLIYSESAYVLYALYTVDPSFKIAASRQVDQIDRLNQNLRIETALNYRQLKILDFLNKNEYIDIAFCRRLFDCTDVTYSRDLRELYEKGYLLRVGKGRSTKYCLSDRVAKKETTLKK